MITRTTRIENELQMTTEEFDILDHTIHRAAGGFYCGEPEAMKSLVERGLMQYAGRKSFVPDKYFSITPAGRREYQKHKNDLRRNQGRG